MAIDYATRHGSAANAADGNYPYGSAKDSSPPESLNGTPLVADATNDVLGILQKLLDATSIVPSGTPDTVPTSQYFEALRQVILSARAKDAFTASGGGNAITLVPLNTNNSVDFFSSYSDLNGMAVRFVPVADNTGATTIDIGNTVGTLLGTRPVQHPDGTALSSGNLTTSAAVTVYFDSSRAPSGAWVLLPQSAAGGGGITVQDEGVALATEATTLNFTGAGVDATGTGATKTITISGSGGTTLNLSRFDGTSSGYARFRIGTSNAALESIILQWGTFSINAQNNSSQTFPLAFPNSAPLAQYATLISSAGSAGAGGFVWANPAATTQTQITVVNFYNQAVNVQWLAIGV